MNLVARLVLFVSLVVALAACPRGTRKTLVPDVPSTGNASARQRFLDAKAKFGAEGTNGAEFGRIAQEFPNDPIRPWADLYAGIAAIKDRKFDAAARALEASINADVDPGLTQRAELFLGIAENYRGNTAKALTLLRRTERFVENDDERTEYLAALAYATADSDRPLAALSIFDQLFGRVTPAEKALIVQRIEDIVATAEPGALGRVFDELSDDRKGPSTAVAATRLSLIADLEGNASEAARLRGVAETARVAVGMPRTFSPATERLPTTGRASGGLGAVLPLGGKSNKVAEAAVAGLGLAAGATNGSGVAAVEVRSAEDAAASQLAVEELARTNVLAIIGPIDSASVDAAGAKADALGVPLLSLSTRAEKNAPAKLVFHMVHSGEQRSRVLAQRALAKGVKKFAILHAQDGYGRAMRDAFKSELERGGGTVVQIVDYKSDTKSFAAVAAKLTDGWEGVFVPAQADVLGLIAPALAATGKVPRPVGTKKVIGGRPVLLVSTAENLTAAYVVSAGRHSEGALFAPGYFPDDRDPASKAFLDAFIASYGRAPGFLEAYAYDAAQLAVAAGGGGRSGLAASLASGTLVGLTGSIKFDAQHRRADPGVIYTVVDESGTFSIRVLP